MRFKEFMIKRIAEFLLSLFIGVFLTIGSTHVLGNDQFEICESEFSGERYYKPMFFYNIEEQRKRLDEFLQEHVKYSEQEKIGYLLSLARASDAVFVRNGSSYGGGYAAKFLRWKMMHRQYLKKPIRSADDFVNRVAVRSNKTGIPYEMILKSGRREKLQIVMRSELSALEQAILQKRHAGSVAKNYTQLKTGEIAPGHRHITV